MRLSKFVKSCSRFKIEFRTLDTEFDNAVSTVLESAKFKGFDKNLIFGLSQIAIGAIPKGLPCPSATDCCLSTLICIILQNFPNHKQQGTLLEGWGKTKQLT